MSKEVIYTGDFVPAKSIIGLLDGSEMFCIANPYFFVEGVRKPDLKQYLEPCSTSKFGVMLKTADIYVRLTPTRPFTNRFSIGWTKGKGIKKDYFFMKLYEINSIPEKFKHKLIITPKSTFTEDDAKLCTFDYQNTVVMDVLLIAKILNIDLSTYKDLKDNTKFFAKFCVDINAAVNKLLGKGNKLQPDEEVKVDKFYIDTFTNPPTFLSKDKKLIPIRELGKPKSIIKTLWDSFYDVYSSMDLESKLATFKAIIKANSFALPTFRFIDVVNKSSSVHERRFDSRLSIIQKLDQDNKNYNANIKDFLITQRCLGPKKFEQITQHNFATLWGSTEEQPDLTKGCTQTGCIFIIPQLEFKYYTQGNPTVEWRVEQLACKRAMNGGNAGGAFDDAAAFVDDEDEAPAAGGGEATQFNEGDEIPI